MRGQATKNGLTGAAVACATVAALALAGGAGTKSTTYRTAKIEVSGPAKLGVTSSVAVHVAVAPTDDPTQKLVIYVPAGYSAKLNAASGAQLGTVSAKVQAADLAGATLPLAGTLQKTDAAAGVKFEGASTTVAAIATECTGTAAHAAFWSFTLSAAGQTLQLPAFVDPAAGAETRFASFKIQICLPPPDVPAGTPGRATFGAKLFDATLTLKGIFTNPRRAGTYVWSALFTPYSPGVGTTNAAASVEARSIVLVPVTITLEGKYDRKRRAAVLRGTLTLDGQDSSGIQVALGAGLSPSQAKLEPAGRSSRTTKAGAFTAVRPITKTTYFVAVFGIQAAVEITARACSLALPEANAAPAGCVSGNLGKFSATSNIVKIAVPKAR